MIKYINSVILIFVFLLCCNSFARMERRDIYTIEAGKNANYHNNLGLIALEDKDYYAAIDEFNIAIQLNPQTHATAVYYNNLGETYMKIGEYAAAQTSFENAIRQFNLNLLFYKNLVASFKAQGKLKSKIAEYRIKSEKNPLSKIILGLCYIENGQTRNGIITLDSFCMSEPDLIITFAVKSYIKSIIKDMD